MQPKRGCLAEATKNVAIANCGPKFILRTLDTRQSSAECDMPGWKGGQVVFVVLEAPHHGLKQRCLGIEKIKKCNSKSAACELEQFK